ncbi:MAG: hypothetical protein II518_02610 [Candidatus Methanomethylophilus sp.]|nr:hypothetical protein [Methanomethylophilus sp.]
MKKTFLYLAAAALLAGAACSKFDERETVPAEQTPAEGSIHFSLTPEDGPEDGSRAVSAYTAAQPYETQVNRVQVLVFNPDGKLASYKDNGTSLSGSISTAAGEKTVWAVINGPDLQSVGTLTALQTTAVDLGANSTTAATGFVMAGNGSCTVTGTGSVDCKFNVSRLVSRVALTSVTNHLPSSYGALKVERVFLCSAVGNQNIAGNASPSTWYNKDGRADESTRNAGHIIDGSTYNASCPTLTYRSVSQNVANGGTHSPSTPYLFYAFPNSATAAPNGFSDPFTAKRTVLTVVATVGGEIQYYPVVLDDAVLARNTAYTVALTIEGLGSDDPNKPVSKGSISVTLTVSGWSAGAVYEETI